MSAPVHRPATLFISDLHLEPGRPEITNRFLEFLAGQARRAEALYILGDLFEVWLGDDAAGTFAGRIAGALSDTASAGPRIYFMAGNRDFLIGQDFCHRAGMGLIAEPARIDLYGTPAVLMHGDVLCTRDVSYQRFRRKVRNPEWQRRMLSKPRWLRRALARVIRTASRVRNANKPEAIMDVTPDAVPPVFRNHNVTRLIHGHTHRPAVHELEIDGAACRRIVLGDWFEQGSVLEVTPAGFDLKTIPRGTEKPA